MEYRVIKRALEEALVEEAKAKCAIDSLLRQVGEKRREYLADTISKKGHYIIDGIKMLPAGTSCDVFNWKTREVSVSAYFIIDKSSIPDRLTEKERKIVKEYIKIFDNIEFRFLSHVKEWLPEIKKLDRELYGLKNAIKLYQEYSWSYDIEKLLNNDNVLNAGFRINNVNL